jgi:hypothetical protein
MATLHINSFSIVSFFGLFVGAAVSPLWILSVLNRSIAVASAYVAVVARVSNGVPRSVLVKSTSYVMARTFSNKRATFEMLKTDNNTNKNNGYTTVWRRRVSSI